MFKFQFNIIYLPGYHQLIWKSVIRTHPRWIPERNDGRGGAGGGRGSAPVARPDAVVSDHVEAVIEGGVQLHPRHVLDSRRLWALRVHPRDIAGGVEEHGVAADWIVVVRPGLPDDDSHGGAATEDTNSTGRIR